MGIMIAPELSYYPTAPTDEELAVLSHTNRHEHSQSSGDITAALGTAALAFTGGLIETPTPSIEYRGSEAALNSDTQRELGNIATTLTLSRQFSNNDYDLGVHKAYEPSVDSLADAAYLLATETNSRDVTNQAIKQASYELAA